MYVVRGWHSHRANSSDASIAYIGLHSINLCRKLYNYRGIIRDLVYVVL